MTGWQNEEIEEKFSLALENINLDIEMATAQKRNERLDKQIADADEEFEVSCCFVPDAISRKFLDLYRTWRKS
jgi:hypothetical protein